MAEPHDSSKSGLWATKQRRIALREEGGEASFFQAMEDLSSEIPRTLLISSIGNMKLES